MTHQSAQLRRPDWAERPVRGLLRLAWPVAVANVSYATMTLADTLFVGRLGPSALAGVGLGGVCTMALVGFGAGALRGAKVVLAQSRGAGRGEEDGPWVAGAALLTALFIAALIALAGRGLLSLLPLFSASAEAGAHASTYVAIRTGAGLAPLLLIALREVRYGLGDTRTPVVVALLGNVVNVGLDYVAIFELDMGVAGAAWATVIAFTFKALVLIVVQHRDGIRFGNKTWSAQRRVLREGLATGMHFAFDIGAATALCAVLAGLSDRDMAAHQIGIQVSAFSFLPALALAEAATVLVGEAVGARCLSLVKHVARRTVLTAVSYALMCSAGLIACASLVVRAFTSDAGLTRVALPVISLVACFSLVDAAATVGHGVLRGVSDQRYSMLSGALTAWLCTLPLGWFLASRLGWGAPGAWVAMSTELTITSVLVWWRVERGGWLRAHRRAAVTLQPVAPTHTRAS